MAARAKPLTPIPIFLAGRASETAGMGLDLARSVSDPAGGPLSKLEEPLSKLGKSWIQLSEPHNQLVGPQIQPGGPSDSARKGLRSALRASKPAERPRGGNRGTDGEEKDGPGPVMVSDTFCPAVHILGT